MLCLVWLLLLQAAAGGAVGPSEVSARARQALLAGDGATAARLYRELLKLMPQDPRLRMNLALALEASGLYAQELTELQRVTRVHPDMTSAWLLTGLAHQKLGQPAAAIEPLRKVLRAEPRNPVASIELGDALLASGKPEEALEIYRVIVRDDAASASGWEGVALSAAASAKHKLESMQSGALTDGSRLLLAQAAIAAGRYREAFGLVGGISHVYCGVHLLRAEIYTKTDHSDWARTEQEREGATSEEPPPDYRMVIQRREEAQKALDQLLSMPESAEQHQALARIYSEQGKRAESIAQWRAAAKQKPDDTSMRVRLAAALSASRFFEESIQILQPLVAQKPEAAEWQFLLGDALAHSGETDAAIPHLQTALRLNPGLTAAHIALGRVLLEADKPAEAIPHLRAAVDSDPETILFQLSVAYRSAGKPAEAEKAVQQRQMLVGRKKAAVAPVEEGGEIVAPK